MAGSIDNVMSKDVATVEADANLTDAARLMRDRDIGDVVVTDQGKVTGVVTDRDITIRATADGAEPGSTEVREVMSEDVATVSPDQSVDDALELMRKRAVRRVVVTDNGDLAGIVSLGDLASKHDEGDALEEISEAKPNR